MDFKFRLFVIVKKSKLQCFLFITNKKLNIMKNCFNLYIKTLLLLFVLCSSASVHAQFIGKTPANIPADGKIDWVVSKVDFPAYNRLGHLESGIYGDPSSKWASIGVPNLNFPPLEPNYYGFFANNQSDRLFVGLRQEGPFNVSNAIIAFGDNHDNDPVPNRLVFKFDSWVPTFSKEIATMLANGNVGIGITAPLQKLHLHDGVMMLSGANAFGGPMMVFSSNLTTHPNGYWGIEYAPADQGLNFWRPFNPSQPGSGNYFMFLSDDDGAVSIGTKNSPTTVGVNNTINYRLFVKGGILTDEILVQTGWADYVFDDNYQLPTLQDVEKHIEEKGYLPNVPSAKEVIENGLELGKMAVTQQEKIEELFLYVIQLNKDVQILRAENELLRQTMNPQKSASNEK